MKRITITLAAMLAIAGCANHSTGSVQKTDTAITLDDTTTTQNMQKTYEFIKACGTYYISTVEGDQPRVRPFGTINIFDGKLYIQTGHIKNVAKQIAANPKVELCCFNGSEWLRLSGTLVEDTSIEAKKSMLDAYPDLRSMYDENDGNTAVYFFKDASARFCSFTRPEETVTF